MSLRNAVALTLLFLTGCGVGPRYQRPAVSVPDAYRGGAANQPSNTAGDSLGDQAWSSIFPDETLQNLVRTALQQNYDVRVAAARILQAEARVGITRADQFLTVDAGAQLSSQRIPESRFSSFRTTEGGLSVTGTWELDFWKKFRSATDSARASLLASQWTRQAIVGTLVSGVAAAYFELRELDLELEISRRTLVSRHDSLQLVQLLADRGLTSILDVRQAEQLAFTASQAIPDLERRIEQQENLLSALLGSVPVSIDRGRELTAQPVAPEVPAGLPATLLERRPDIRQAEQQLIAVNAQIGVIKAAVFPQIALTGTGGVQSSALSSLFSGPAGMWNFVGALTQPIFSSGKLRAGVQLVEAQQQEASLVYEQTIQRAFREVSDALIAYRQNQESRRRQELLTRSTQESAQLADARYRAGVTSYLEVLTNETNYFAAQRGLAQAQLGERLALVELYRALGGGWQQ